jgi:hypothetical protein
MRLEVLRFLALLTVTLVFAMAFAHVMELPGKLRLDGPAWLLVQHNLYVAFGPAGAVLEPLAIMLAWLLAGLSRKSGRPYGLSLLAALCVTLGLLEWTVVVRPLNMLLNGWTAATLPSDWTACRNRWELGHAIHAGLFAIAFCALLGSAWMPRRSLPHPWDRASGVMDQP